MRTDIFRDDASDKDEVEHDREETGADSDGKKKRYCVFGFQGNKMEIALHSQKNPPWG
jgi:hypothetical protein